MQDTAVESMENGIPKTIERDEAPFPRAHHAPHDQAHDGREPPGDVALVHAPGPYGQREEHSGSATGDGEERQDPPVRQTGVPIVVIARHDQIVDGEQQERDHVDGDQIYKEGIHRRDHSPHGFDTAVHPGSIGKPDTSFKDIPTATGMAPRSFPARRPMRRTSMARGRRRIHSAGRFSAC